MEEGRAAVPATQSIQGPAAGRKGRKTGLMMLLLLLQSGRSSTSPATQF